MNVDDIITLDDGKEYIILFKSIDGGINYYLGVECASNEPTDHYEIFKEMINNGETFVEEVTDSALLEKLLDDFENQFDKENVGEE